LLLPLLGGFKTFQKVMPACAVVASVAGLLTAVLLRPDWSQRLVYRKSRDPIQPARTFNHDGH